MEDQKEEGCFLSEVKSSSPSGSGVEKYFKNKFRKKGLGLCPKRLEISSFSKEHVFGGII